MFDFLRRKTPEIALLEAEAAAVAGAGYRRNSPTGVVPVEPVIAAKLLHAWLQNRHQTLVPLTFNLKSLDTERRALLAEGFVALIEAGRPLGEVPAAAALLRGWLQRLGADEDCLAAFDRARERPPALGRFFANAQSSDLSLYVYVLALGAVDPLFPGSAKIPDLVQARFDIGAAAARSAQRRYRR